MAHITKPIKEKAENNSFGGLNIVFNTNEDGTREDEFPSRLRRLLSDTPGKFGTEVGIPLCWCANLTTSRERLPFQEQVDFSAVRPS
jgi:hypothetical protein